MARKYADLDKVDTGKSVKCPTCGSDNIYSEFITEKEWQGGVEIDKSHYQYTCLNLECGEVFT
jgi:uncharacterized protein (DUF983 family)